MRLFIILQSLIYRKDFLNEDFVQLFPKFVGEKGMINKGDVQKPSRD